MDPRFAHGPLAVVDVVDGQVWAYCAGGLILDIPAKSLPSLVEWTLAEARLGAPRLNRNVRDADPRSGAHGRGRGALRPSGPADRRGAAAPPHPGARRSAPPVSSTPRNRAPPNSDCSTSRPRACRRSTFKDRGRRAQGLLVEFTDIDSIEVDP
ncbi:MULTISPECIES: hypothetical protein [Streptomyces violaceusniger group]|uniref:hypothetical protein n=1 Tax=Streptomyces violaceusniger group TaxID=2839105 RepID=UPI003873B05D